LYVLNRSVRTELEKHGIKVANTYVGNYMTAIDMAGASITILKLDDTLKKYLNAPSETISFK
jgi:dihydroxyacetone kinase